MQTVGLEAALKQAPVGLSMVDRELRYRTVNETMAQLNGLASDRHIGRKIAEIQPDLAEALGPLLQRLFRSGLALHQVEIRGKSPHGERRPYTWVVNVNPVLSDDGSVELALIAAFDVTRQKEREESLIEALSRQEIGFLEQSRRISQGLQVIYNALVVETDHSAELSARNAFESASRRLHALNVIHCQLQRAEDYSQPSNIRKFLHGLCDDLAAAFVSGDHAQGILLDCDSGISLSQDKLLSIGIIVSELITNSYQYAYASKQTDIGIHLSLRRVSEQEARLIVSDDAKGLQQATTGTNKGLGMKIVQSQVNHLQGTLKDECSSLGARISVTFPLTGSVRASSL